MHTWEWGRLDIYVPSAIAFPDKHEEILHGKRGKGVASLKLGLTTLGTDPLDNMLLGLPELIGLLRNWS